jgi:hypothetical protein
LGVVGIQTVRTILVLSAMEPNLQAMAADVSNAFLYGKNKERTMKADPEFDDLQGQYLVVEGGWYGHKTAAATFNSHLAANLRKMGFFATKAGWFYGYRKLLMNLMNTLLLMSMTLLQLVEHRWSSLINSKKLMH